MKILGRHSLQAAAVAGAVLLGSPSVAAPSDDLIKKGEYLTTLGDCVGCHKAVGGKPFAGGLYMPTPFGDISTPNITPDKATGIGAWTDDQFYRAMHEGIGHDGEYLYPVFPFPWYTKVSRDDVLAIKAYLFSLAPENAPRKPLRMSFPFNVREGLLSWRTGFFRAETFVSDKNKSAELNRGEYLVTGLGHCGECHNHSKLTGATDWSGDLQGGVIEGWYAPNLTSDGHEGVGQWSKEDLVKYLKTGAAPTHGVAAGPMRETIYDSLQHVKDEDLGAMAVYLKSVKAEASYKPERINPKDLSHTVGAEAYYTYCASCHQNNGKGIEGQIPNLADNGTVRSAGPENVIRVVVGGLSARNGYGPMPAVGAGMTDNEIADATNFVRSAWSNGTPSAVGPGAVAALRKNTRTLLNGNNGDCTPTDKVELSQKIESKTLQELHGMTLGNMIGKIDQMLPKVKAEDPNTDENALVNGMIAAYCKIIANDTKLPPAQRIATLGNFGSLVYGRLKYGPKK